MTETTTTLPARCPVCGDTDRTVFADRDGPWGCRFKCEATYFETGGWSSFRSCKHAMTACLRTGATLTPTAAEMARDTLVARSLRLAKRLAKYKPLIDVSDLEDDDADDSATINLHMDVVSFLADADAYLLAAQPQPAASATAPRPADGEAAPT